MMQRIEQEFGSFVNFQTEFSVTAQARPPTSLSGDAL